MIEAATELITGDRVRTFAAAVLERTGMSPEDARDTADALAWADLRSIPPQGLAKLPLIVARLRAGGNRANASVDAVGDRGAFTVLDAHDAWGHVAGIHGMRTAIEKARTSGVGLAVVRNTSSGSAMGYYALLAVRERMIGIAINDTTPLMPPTGGTAKVLGNQAFAIGCPAGRHDPILMDTATSAITWTGIEEYLVRGEQLPPGLALAADGSPTTDPAAALAGIMLPMGGHRGYGLALMFEVLTGVLSGGARIANELTPLSSLDQPQGVSHFMLAIDPAVALPYDEFTARVDRLIDQIHASPPASGVAHVLVPGERGFEVARARERDGFVIPAEVAAKVRALGAETGVPW